MIQGHNVVNVTNANLNPTHHPICTSEEIKPHIHYNVQSPHTYVHRKRRMKRSWYVNLAGLIMWCMARDSWVAEPRPRLTAPCT